LHLSVPVNLNDLPALLGSVADKYIDTSYKKNFPWVDHIAEVTNTAKQDELDIALVEEIRADHIADIWMAVPDIVEWRGSAGFDSSRQAKFWKTLIFS
jgi:uncharacterized protein (TIGR04141 family)